VGAKHEIYELIFRLRDQGCTILLVTTEMPELLSLADRILVLHRGRITAQLDGATATQEQVLAAAMGETETEASAA
jgi:ribose transport system ATP-binding protein